MARDFLTQILKETIREPTRKLRTSRARCGASRFSTIPPVSARDQSNKQVEANISKALVLYEGAGGSTPMEIDLNVAAVKEPLFTKNELEGMHYIQETVDEDLLEVICGCRHRRFGDYTGILKIHRDGAVRITCNCAPNCDQVNITPEAFMKHIENPRPWQSCMFVNVGEEKQKLKKSALLKYYLESCEQVQKMPKFKPHRDEFLKCSKCSARRRLKQKTANECRAYHDAQIKKDWECKMHPMEEIDCQIEEERASKMRLRGCPRRGNCNGCVQCVCLGCTFCRFADCQCRICEDFNRANQREAGAGRHD